MGSGVWRSGLAASKQASHVDSSSNNNYMLKQEFWNVEWELLKKTLHHKKKNHCTIRSNFAVGVDEKQESERFGFNL